MTTSSALVPSTRSVRVVEAVARVHEVLDEVDTGAVGAVTGRDIAAVDRAIARMEALKLRLVAAAHRTDAGSDAGMSGTSAWLASSTRTWGAKAAADVSLATALEESLPVTRRALEAGSLSVAHAAVIAGVAGRLPGSLSEVERIEDRDRAGAAGAARRPGPAAPIGAPSTAGGGALGRRGRRTGGRRAPG